MSKVFTIDEKEYTVIPCTAVAISDGDTEEDRQFALFVVCFQNGETSESVVFGYPMPETGEDFANISADSSAWDSNIEVLATVIVMDYTVSNHNFAFLFSQALASPDRDNFVAQYSTAAILGVTDSFLTNDELLLIAKFCGDLWDAAHRSVRQIKEESGMTQAQLAERFCIPRRTIENWCAVGGKESRPCPDYIRLMMQEALGFVDRNIFANTEGSDIQ